MVKGHFKDKVIWITGASSGIGEELTRQFAELGARLIISARRKDKLELLAKQLTSEPERVKVLPLDLESIEDAADKAAEAIPLFGQIDYFISNAGLAIRALAIDTDINVDQKLMNINYFGSIAITKKLLPHFIKRKQGHVVVISSLSGKYGVPKIAAYSASKHALHGFYESLRSEIIHPGIFITIVIPGIIKTSIIEHAVTGKGNIYGRNQKTFETAYPTKKAANKIIKAIASQKEEVFVGGSESVSLWINRISPWLLRRLIKNHPVRRVRKLISRLLFRNN